MANNLHISYDLHTPGQNYEEVIEKVKSLGSWAKVHLSYWYVSSSYTASEALDQIKPALDKNDKVYVVDATNNIAAWNQLSDEVASHIKEKWNR